MTKANLHGKILDCYEAYYWESVAISKDEKAKDYWMENNAPQEDLILK